MTTLITVLHVLFCIFLILVILLQTGKGAGMGAAFGGSSSTVFGPRGAGSFIGKMTGIVAFLFMVSSLTLAFLSSSSSTSLEERAALANEERGGQEVDLEGLSNSKSEDREAAKESEPAPEKAVAPAADSGVQASKAETSATPAAADAGN